MLGRQHALMGSKARLFTMCDCNSSVNGEAIKALTKGNLLSSGLLIKILLASFPAPRTISSGISLSLSLISPSSNLTILFVSRQ
jgi:hypothetical protein